MEYTDLKQIEKDICFLYHELSEYSGIMGDLDYHTLYNKKYWTYIDVDTDPFILHGCLILVLAMIWDWIDGSGNYIEDKIVYYKNAMKTLYGQSEDEFRLIEAVNKGLEIVEKDKQKDDKFEMDSLWAFETFVMGYFQEKAGNRT
jgi:hypothetical protein